MLSSKGWGDTGAITLFYDGKGTSYERLWLIRGASFDFETLHKCRKFDTINDWTKENGVKGVTMDN